MTQPTRASESEFAVVTVAGEVLVADILTGSVRWQRKPGLDVGLARTSLGHRLRPRRLPEGSRR